MPNIGPVELIIILVIALLILGPGRLPDVGSALGKSIREFRKAATDVQDSVKLDAPPATAAPVAPTAATPAAPAAPAPNSLAEAATPNVLAAAPPVAEPLVAPPLVAPPVAEPPVAEPLAAVPAAAAAAEPAEPATASAEPRA